MFGVGRTVEGGVRLEHRVGRVGWGRGVLHVGVVLLQGLLVGGGRRVVGQQRLHHLWLGMVPGVLGVLGVP